jgi:hypothetical protein
MIGRSDKPIKADRQDDVDIPRLAATIIQFKPGRYHSTKSISVNSSMTSCERGNNPEADQLILVGLVLSEVYPWRKWRPSSITRLQWVMGTLRSRDEESHRPPRRQFALVRSSFQAGHFEGALTDS